MLIGLFFTGRVIYISTTSGNGLVDSSLREMHRGLDLAIDIDLIWSGLREEQI